MGTGSACCCVHDVCTGKLCSPHAGCAIILLPPWEGEHLMRWPHQPTTHPQQLGMGWDDLFCAGNRQSFYGSPSIRAQKKAICPRLHRISRGWLRLSCSLPRAVAPAAALFLQGHGVSRISTVPVPGGRCRGISLQWSSTRFPCSESCLVPRSGSMGPRLRLLIPKQGQWQKLCSRRHSRS